MDLKESLGKGNKIMSKSRYLIPGTVLLSGSAAYALTDERTRLLYTSLAPVILHYRLIEWKHKWFPPASEEAANTDWEALHHRYAVKVKDTFMELRGFYVKVAQMLANRNDDLPSMYVENLRLLEDSVPPLLLGDHVKEAIRQELKLERLEDVFEWVETTPIGSASIGQTHRARLKSTGQMVAIKIQSPGAEALFRHDVKGARRFCSWFVPEQVIIFDEIEKQFLTEFDYRKEAEHLETVYENMRLFSRLVAVPKPFPQYCTKNVLTMEFLEGPKLVDGVREAGKRYAESVGKTFEELEREIRDKYRKEGLPPPYNGPSAFQLDIYRHWIKMKDAMVNFPRWLFNVFFGRWHPLQYQQSFVPLNSARIMDTLLKVHGHQVLVNGYFNADPHPGNILLLKDGRLGLIDYGQVKKLTKHERLMLARLMYALAVGDRDTVVNDTKLSGYKSKYYNKEVMYKMSVVGFDQDGRDVTEGLNIQQFVDKMYAMDPWESVLDFYVLPMRVSLLLRGVGLMLNHPVSVATAWKPIAEKILSEAKS
jgi:aarF domain-containing kinase